MGLLTGKVAIITGAGGGIGRCHALACAREGARVVVNDLGSSRDGEGQSRSAADQVAEEIRAAGGEAVADYHSVSTVEGAQAIVQRALEAFGQVDVLVNNAGILRDKTLWNMTEDMFDLVIAVHLKGTYACGQAAFRWMKDQGRPGRIINTSSYAGLKGNFGQTNYAAAKAGIYGMSMVWALEGRKYGITCNVLAPMAKTRMTEELEVVPPEMHPEQISPVALFLASDLAGDVTGRVFGIHGQQILEYRMEMTPGVTKEGDALWTPGEIAAKLDRIGAMPGGGPDAGAGLRQAFEELPGRFLPEKAAGWDATLVFDIAGGSPCTLQIRSGRVSLHGGKVGTPTCVVTVDAATITGILGGTVNPQQAFMQGKVKASNLADMMKFGQCFDLTRKEDLAAATSGAGAAAGGGTGEPAPAGPGRTFPPAPVAVGPEGLNKACVGKVYEGPEREITAAAIDAYARAVNDDNPRYRADSAGAQLRAPPLFVVTLLMDQLGLVVGDPELRVDMLRLVHGEQGFVFHRPVRPGDRIRSRGTLTSIEDRSSGQIFTLDIGFLRGDEPVASASTVIFIRRPRKGEPRPATAPGAATPPAETRTPVLVESAAVDPDQSRRYAAASGDHNPIHLDPDVARAAGLEDIILHGLCTMAFACRAVVDGSLAGDPDRLRSFFVRFSKPVSMGDTLTTTAWSREIDGEGELLDLETRNQHGALVLSQGRAGIRRA